MSDDKRLIEDYLPIEAISTEASREKSVRKGHISTLHLWWARRPLVACRAAVYGALVPASRFVPNGGSDEQKQSLGRANSAKFVKALCLYPGELRNIEEARRHILIAHADRLSLEVADWKAGNITEPVWAKEFKFLGTKVTMEDITAGRAPRPRVLDMFAGGGAIPLEAQRLGCEAFALDLNPVAHIIQLCTLVYPQKYGKPDTTARGMTGPENDAGNLTWGGLAKEVSYWGNWALKKVKADMGDLYPLIPDPHCKGKPPAVQAEWFKTHDPDEVPAGYLMPVAYLWTRTVKCKNPVWSENWICMKMRYFATAVRRTR
jgi:putative DNA methylase